MKVTILDTVSRATVEAEGEAYYWTEGNGCCDCNRGMLVLGSDVWPRETSDVCAGTRRFLIIKADNHDYHIQDFNAGYPKELMKEEGLIP